MTVLDVALVLVALALAIGWIVDSHCQRTEFRDDYGRLEKRVTELGDKLLNLRRRGVGLPPRPVIRWHEEIERRIPRHRNPGGI